ncbi:MAG: carbohydrate kinase [Hespellia sp.]|nr:carbohydrate kinase [Hespellia sp.]
MGKEVDIVAMGELLIDFTESGVSESGMKLFEQNPGGAPANLLTVASHMGYSTAFVGKVGKDMHGAFLKKTLKQEGICTDYLLEDERYFTTLAFVELNANGEREFSFSRKPGADTQLQKEELDQELLESCKIFHYGSLSLTDEPARTATVEAVTIAKQAGALISYDPNYRASLWPDEETAVVEMKSMIHYADVLKVSDVESLLLTGKDTFEEAIKVLLSMGPKLVAVTLGKDGVLLGTKNGVERVPGVTVKTVDTTGAGDSFWGGFLSQYLSNKKCPEQMSWEEWKTCAVCGNATAALCVQKRGGIPAMPAKKEVEVMLAGRELRL